MPSFQVSKIVSTEKIDRISKSTKRDEEKEIIKFLADEIAREIINGHEKKMFILNYKKDTFDNWVAIINVEIE